jgi:hypothetical protein
MPRFGAWSKMEEIRQEPCTHCGQASHTRTCLAELSDRINEARTTAREAIDQAAKMSETHGAKLAEYDEQLDLREKKMLAAIAERDEVKALYEQPLAASRQVETLAEAVSSELVSTPAQSEPEII